MSVQFVIDAQGKKTGVFMSLEDYEELLERAEDAEALAFLRHFESEVHQYVGLEEALAGLQADA